MKKIVQYKDINQTLKGIRIQVIDSLDYCINEMPQFENPEQMFNYLKLMVTYHLDPPGIELLQSVPTLFDENYWNIPGAGDCDCFTILTLAMCIANGWNNNYIVLVGRSKKAPVHIYSATVFEGEFYTLDLTNPYIGIERPYKFRQLLEC